MEPIANEVMPKHSEEMQDIILKPPSWILKWGITVFFISLLLIISLTAFVKYPDVVKTQLIVTSSRTPKPIVSKVSGRLVTLFVSNNQYVSLGSPLAVLESNADYKDVLKLSALLKIVQSHLRKNNDSDLVNLFIAENLKLGEIQDSYQSFYQSWLMFNASEKNGYYMRKKRLLEVDIRTAQKGEDILRTQLELQRADLRIAEEEYLVHKKLNEQKVVARQELKREESKFIAKNLPVQQTEAALLTSYSSQVLLNKQILEIDNMMSDERLKFQQALNSLISQVEKWSSNHLLSATSDGRVIFAGITQENQYCKVNQELFYIDHEQGDFFGQMAIPQYNMGKVKSGQKVLIKLDSYPFEEYGLITGRVQYVSNVPYRDSIFISQVDFDKSSFNSRNLMLKNGMIGKADIVTDDASILERMVRSFFKVINSREI